MTRTIMAIGAHIGDMELSAGMTLATHAVRGDRIVTVALTAGERGGPPELDAATFGEKNREAARAFAEALSGEARFLNYPDGEIPDDEDVRFQICDLIRAYTPDVIITHWKDGLHKDHRRTSAIVRDAHYYAALRGLERKDPPHAAGGPYYAENWEDAPGFDPYVSVDVSEGYALWRRSITRLWLTEHSPWFRYLDYYDALSTVRGARAMRSRAECFDVDPESKRIVRDHL